MKKILPFLIILTASIYSCKDEIKIDPDNLFIGIWNYAGNQDNTSVYVRSREFTNNHCYRFNYDGTLIERNYSGWCATPPVSYSDYPGGWTVLNDTLIRINVGYWGGRMTYKLDIELLSPDSLKIVNIGDTK